MDSIISPQILGLRSDASKITDPRYKKTAQQFIDATHSRIKKIEEWHKAVFDKTSEALLSDKFYLGINFDDTFYLDTCNSIVQMMLQIKTDFSDLVLRCNLFSNVESELWQVNFKKNFHKIFIDRTALTSSSNYRQYNQVKHKADYFYAQSFANSFGFMLAKAYIEFALEKEGKKTDITPEYILSAFKSFGQCLLSGINSEGKKEITTGLAAIDYASIVNKVLAASEYGIFFYSLKPAEGILSNIFDKDFKHEDAFLSYAKKYLKNSEGLVDDIDIQKEVADFCLEADSFTHVFFDANGRSAVLMGFFLSIINNLSPIKTFYECDSSVAAVKHGGEYFAKFIDDPNIGLIFEAPSLLIQRYLDSYKRCPLENFMFMLFGAQKDIPAYFSTHNMAEDLYVSAWDFDDGSGEYRKIIGKSNLCLFSDEAEEYSAALNARIASEAIEANREEIFDSFSSLEGALMSGQMGPSAKSFFYKVSFFAITRFVMCEGAPFSEQDYNMAQEIGKVMHLFLEEVAVAKIKSAINDSWSQLKSEFWLNKALIPQYCDVKKYCEISGEEFSSDRGVRSEAEGCCEFLKLSMLELLNLKAENLKSIKGAFSELLLPDLADHKFDGECEAIVKKSDKIKELNFDSLEKVKEFIELVETDKYLSNILKLPSAAAVKRPQGPSLENCALVGSEEVAMSRRT